MDEMEQQIDWSKTTFEGVRKEQLKQALAMTVRERLEALDHLTALSERLQAMPKQSMRADVPSSVCEPQPAYRVTPQGNDIVLEGCTPTPLANYLKALGVLRLLSAKHPDVRGFWRGDRFVLRTVLTRGDVEQFFLNEYEPSALITPWNGRGGFLEGDDEGEDDADESKRAGAVMVRLFSSGDIANRFKSLGETLQFTASVDAIARLNGSRSQLKRLKAVEKAKGKGKLSDEEKEAIKRQDAEVKNAKGKLLQDLRNSLPDDVLAWFDTCLALVNDSNSKVPGDKKSVPTPLLGAGGLDGSMDFGVNYLKRLNDVFDPLSGSPRKSASELLNAALFGDVTDRLFSVSLQDKKKVSVGQFSPARAGGYNADTGFSGEALLNPWDTILQLEGAVLFAASTVRRLEGDGDIYASLPFTVAPTAIGDGIAASDEAPKGAKRRTAETWLPLWSQPATCRELCAVFQEGRITLHGTPVTVGFDCVRALASLGASRGIGSFQRTVFLKRAGDAFFALDGGRFDVKESKYNELVDELEGKSHFLTKFHSFVREKTNSGEWKASGRLRSAGSRLDGLIVRVLRNDDKQSVLQALEQLGELQEVLGELQEVIARSKESKEVRKVFPPIPRLSAWVAVADDGSPAFRIAKALAGLSGTGNERLRNERLPLRAQWFPVQREKNQWMTADGDEKVRIFTGQRGRLPEVLTALLERRLWLAERLEMKDKPLDSPAGATLEDISAFLRDDSMDARIIALLPGLCLCDIPQDVEKSAGEGMVPAAFCLLKLALTPDRVLRSLSRLGEQERLPVPAGMVAKLASGNHGNRAVEMAWRRLRASGLAPAFALDALPELRGIDPLRMAAALLIPLRYGATAALARQALKTREPETEREPA